MNMPNLTERQKTLLLLIIRDYIDSAQPVGSKRLTGIITSAFPRPPYGMKWPRSLI